MSDEKQRVAALLSRLAEPPNFRSWDLDGGQAKVVAAAAAGDDCAVIDFSGEVSLVWGSDYVRGSKFPYSNLASSAITTSVIS